MATLNPAFITANRAPMPQINGRATTSFSGIDTTPISSGSNSASGRGMSDVLGSIGQFIQNPIMSGIGGIASNLLNLYVEDKRAQQQRDWNEKMMDKQNQFSLDMWNKTNAYNSPSAQKERMIAAGLNPLFYGLDGSSANAFESASPLGYDRASNPNGISNPIPDMLQAQAQIASIENTKAATQKIKSETTGTALDNEFKQKTMDARVDGQKLANEATKQQIELTKVQKQKGLKEIEKIIEETKTEAEKRNLIVLQQAVQKATEKQILELLPYQKNLMAAQTYAQKCAATASYYNAMYQKGLIDSGYIKKLNEQLDADIARNKAITDKENAIRYAQEFTNSIMSGNFFELGDGWFANNVLEGPMNGLLQDLMVLKTCFPINIGASL